MLVMSSTSLDSISFASFMSDFCSLLHTSFSLFLSCLLPFFLIILIKTIMILITTTATIILGYYPAKLIITNIK